MLFFLKKWKDLRNVKKGLLVRGGFYESKMSLSMRVSNEPLTFLINAEGKAKEMYSDNDFVVVNGLCEQIFEGNDRPAVEACLHAVVYKKTEAGCVLQVQTVDCHLITEVYGKQREITFDRKTVQRALGADCVEAVTIPIVEDIKQVVALLEENPTLVAQQRGGMLVEDYGLVTWAHTPEDAKKWLEGLEYLMSYHVKLLMIKGAQSSVM